MGVPGTVGGGVYMNAGCHGGDWSEVVEQVAVVDADGQTTGARAERDPVRLPAQRARRAGSWWRRPCGSGRRSRPGWTKQIAEMFEWRQQGTPFNQPCCGSVFQNPAGPSWKRQSGPRTAGQLIEAAGLKGFAIGGAEISPMHANYFVNTGEATAADVRALIAHARGVVQEQFGVRLETEVKLIGRRGST